jgi:hypothetical protein
MSPEEMRARADACERMAVSFRPVNSDMMRDVAALWLRLADDAEARAANPLTWRSSTIAADRVAAADPAAAGVAIAART